MAVLKLPEQVGETISVETQFKTVVLKYSTLRCVKSEKLAQEK